MPDLKKDHPPLYRRVRKKFIVHTLLGLTLIFFSPNYTPNAQGSIMEKFASLHVHGVVFILLGLGIGLGLFYLKHSYRLARFMMATATGYNMTWLLALIIKVFEQPASLPIVVLWGYWVSNLFEITTDPSWDAISIVKEIKEAQNGGDR